MIEEIHIGDILKSADEKTTLEITNISLVWHTSEKSYWPKISIILKAEGKTDFSTEVAEIDLQSWILFKEFIKIHSEKQTMIASKPIYSPTVLSPENIIYSNKKKDYENSINNVNGLLSTYYMHPNEQVRIGILSMPRNKENFKMLIKKYNDAGWDIKQDDIIYIFSAKK